MRAGLLKKTFAIQEVSTSQNSLGEAIQTYTTVDHRKGGLDPLTGKELFTAQMTLATVSHKITMRYHPSVKPKNRLVHNCRVFNIAWVKDKEEMHKEITAYCTEEV